jgi:hypothetical protein
VITAGMVYGQEAYFTSGWNIMDGSLVIISIIDLLMSLVSEGSPRIFNILRVLESFYKCTKFFGPYDILSFLESTA